MSLSKAELVIHPVRLRILQVLAGEQLTTTQISAALPEAPTSTIYRHLRLLRKGNMIAVVETRLVNGIQEKVYGMAQPAYLTGGEVNDLSPEGHLEMFTTWLLTNLPDFAAFLARSAEAHGQPDLAAEGAGYTEVVFQATDAEIVALGQALNGALLPFLMQEPAAGRRKRKLATILFPLE